MARLHLPTVPSAFRRITGGSQCRCFQKMDERLMIFLNKKSELTGSNIIAITHEQLALELGTARVVVSRLLKQLEIEGHLKLGRNKISLM